MSPKKHHQPSLEDPMWTIEISEEGEAFVWMMFHFTWIVLMLMAFHVMLWRYLRKREASHREARKLGLFAHARWPVRIRGSLSLFCVTLLIIPLSLNLASFAFGPVLAYIEGWPVALGTEYIVSNLLGLMRPLTDAVPRSMTGQIVDLILSVWGMLFLTSAMGVAAGMSLASCVVDMMPKTFGGLLRALLLYVPAALLLICLPTGGLMSLAEGWSLYDGFLFMAESAAGLANPLHELQPKTATGCFIEVLCVSTELCLGGAVIGLIGSHPLAKQAIHCMEGNEKSDTQILGEERRCHGTERAEEIRKELERLRAETMQLEKELAEVTEEELTEVTESPKFQPVLPSEAGTERSERSVSAYL